jgi:hypothetical protein
MGCYCVLFNSIHRFCDESLKHINDNFKIDEQCYGRNHCNNHDMSQLIDNTAFFVS